MKRRSDPIPTIGLIVMVLVTVILIALSVSNRAVTGSYYDASGIWHRAR